MADQYPLSLQLYDDGKPIPSKRFTRERFAKKDPELQKRLDTILDKRWRIMGTIKLPASALKAGINVLAIEVRRSHYPAAAKKKWFSGKTGKNMPSWVPVCLSEVRLSAVGGDASAKQSRPKGMQVWNEDRNVRLNYKDSGNVLDEITPVKLTGAKNGTFCGQLVVGSDKDIKGLKIVAGNLKAVKGSGVISAKNIDLLYALYDIEFYDGKYQWFDGLQSEPITTVVRNEKEGSAILPVVVRVNIPKGAKAGDYLGSITVSATGEKTAKVPIAVHVADWIIPDPQDYITYIGLYQSPTSIALKYDVPMWSEEHWGLVEKSIALLGRAGNKMVNIPVVDKTQFGNEDGWITWIKKANGTYMRDYRVFDRYMKLVMKYCGPQDYVALQIWHAGGWTHRNADQENTVVVIDEKTGKRSHMQVPLFDSDEAVSFWKPLFKEINDHLVKVGMPDSDVIVGILSDSTAPSEVFAMFDKAMPPVAGWQRGCHTQNRSKVPYKVDKGGGLGVLHEHCYGLSIVDPDKELPGFWDLRGKPSTAYDRIHQHEIMVALSWYRCTAAGALFRQTQGVGRACLDFWPVIPGKWGDIWIYNRYPQSTCQQRRPSLQKMVWAGPDGAETTIRYEAFLEGIQDSEAIVYISRAMEQNAKKLGPELMKECQDILVDNIMFHRAFGRVLLPMRPYYYGWQDLSARLYECAAKIEAVL